MFAKLLLFSSKNLAYLIPISVGSGLILGLELDTTTLRVLIVPVVVLMTYPSMIGFNFRELAHLGQKKLIFLSLVINFVLVPLVSYVLGTLFLFKTPGLFAGLAIASLLPTSSMTVTYTMIARGNVTASVKLTVISLVMGSFLAPWYLYVMIGKYVPVDLGLIFKTLAIVIFLPLMMGILTFRCIEASRRLDEFNERIKPLLPGVSALGAFFVIFITISIESRAMFNNWKILALTISVQAVFYLLNYVLAVLGSKICKLNRGDGYSLVYSTALRSLGISIGLAAAAFGYQATFMTSIAFLIQPIAAAWFARLNERYHFLSATQPPTG